MTKLADGVYDLLITNAVERELAQLRGRREVARQPVDAADANVVLARHVANVVREALRGVPEADRPARQAEISNEVLRAVAASLPNEVSSEDFVAQPAQRLAAVYPIDTLTSRKPRHPEIPLSQSDLLVNARGEPRTGSVLEGEIESADRIDLIVAFIRWSGLRLLEPRLRAFTERGGQLRVITTTYTGSTERLAIEHLVAIGAQVKVSYHVDATRLHAKAWLFHRNSGFSTVFIGSSNLSTAAMVDGVEWNVRLAQSDAPTVVDKFAATFEAYWADNDYELYDPTRDAERFDRAVTSASDETSIPFAAFDIEPWPYQQQMLEQLTVERYRHNRWHNLVVAATGTGKTVVAALDYRRLCDNGIPRVGKRSSAPAALAGGNFTTSTSTDRGTSRGNPSLLFVAHRKEILQQSLATFRTVMRDGNFGELYVDGRKPDEWRHVFASIQSLSNGVIDRLNPDSFDIVIVDEFHHAAAPTYKALLSRLKPKVLLGLTATPERTDGESILPWFDNRIAVELRLWDALDRGLLSPFHYFGVHDNVDISHVAWTRGRYDERELENIYTSNDARLVQIVEQLRQKVGDLHSMRALGFCVGVHHAEFMARRFNERGIPSEAVLGTTDSAARDRALRKLREGEINCLFAVDIFNEGVDVPQIDTVLFLRPTESSLIFLQQLGRGLRRSRDKQCLTVLDFIGNAHRNFRFDLRYRALTGATRRGVEEELDRGFPFLPAGCSIQLDRESSRIVLENLKQSIGSNFRSFVNELRSMTAPVSLARFLHDTNVDPEDLYRNSSWSWTALKRAAGHEYPVDRVADRPLADDHTTGVILSRRSNEGAKDGEGPRGSGAEPKTRTDEQKLLGALGRLLHIDDEPRLTFLQSLLASPVPPNVSSMSAAERRILEGFLLTVWADSEHDIESALTRLWKQDAVRRELVELLAVLDERAAHRTFALVDELTAAHRPRFMDVPLRLHARYTRDEVLAAIGRSTLAKPYTHREGPLWDEVTQTDYFFVTLEKSEKYYSPTTRYRDYAISPDVFHWESQSQTREQSPTGQRYIHHAARGTNVMLLVRPRNKDIAGRTVPFTMLGPAKYIEHKGERPMAILWRLARAMPLDFFANAKIAGG